MSDGSTDAHLGRIKTQGWHQAPEHAVVHRKQSLYFPSEMLREIEREAQRIDRSLSWVVQRCLRTALPDIKRLPSTLEPSPDADGQEVDVDDEDTARLPRP